MGGQLVAPLVLLGVGPGAIQPNRVDQLFWESLPVSSIADEYVAKSATCGEIVDAAAGIAVRVRECKENLAIVAILRAIVPGVTGVNLRVMPPAVPLLRGRFRWSFLGRIEVKNPLAGIAIDQLAGANLV